MKRRSPLFCWCFSGARKVGMICSFFLCGCIRYENQKSYFYDSGVLHLVADRVKIENGFEEMSGQVVEFGLQGRHWLRYSVSQKKIQGKFQFFYEDGNLFRELWFDQGMLNGEAKEFYPDGKKKQIYQYQDGKIEGMIQKFDRDGRLVSQEQWRQGQKHGIFLEYYENAQIRSRMDFDSGQLRRQRAFNPWQILTFVQEVENGSLVDWQIENHEEFYSNGQPRWMYARARAGRHAGRKVGFEKRWHANGVMAQESSFEEGVEIEKRMYSKENIQILREVRTGLEMEGTHWYEQNGVLKAKEFYRENLKHGRWEEYYENGNMRSRTNWKKGKKEGLYEEFDERGEIRLSLEYENDIKNGRAFLYFANGKPKEERSYKNGEFHGPVSLWYENSDPEQISSFVNGKKHGIWIRYFPGKIKHVEVEYQDDLRQGYEKEYSKSGQLLRKTFYEKDLKHKEEEIFDPGSGKLLEKITWEQGKKHGISTVFQEDGSILESQTYRDGFLNGPARYFYKNGKLMQEISFRDGKKYGRVSDYWSNGRLARICSWFDDKQQGLCNWFDERGSEIFDLQQQRELDLRISKNQP